MTASADQRMVEDWNAGLEIPDIAARHDVPSAYVDRVLDDARAAAAKARRWDFSWNRWPTRLVYSIAAGAVVNFAFGATELGTAVALSVFAVSSTVMWAIRYR